MENSAISIETLKECLADRREELSDICIQAITECIKGKPLTGSGGALNNIVSNILNIALQAECECHVKSTKKLHNRRNGQMPKVIESQFGNLNIITPRDRNGSFDPQVVKKREMKLAEGLYEQIVELYAVGMSTRDISTNVKNIYGVTISPESVSHVTSMVLDELKIWEKRTLDPIYPVVWLDAIHYKTMQDGKSGDRAIYNAIALGVDGKMHVLGMYLDHSESSNFWRGVLDDLKSRGVKDVLIMCVDGLTGFPSAIKDVYPQARVQLCIVHQLRNSAKIVGPKNRKAVIGDLSKIHQAPTKKQAKEKLEEARVKWADKYPNIFESWDTKWNMLTTFFDFPQPLRCKIYTTNAIESYHSQLRRLTKTKGCFSTDNSLLKLAYLRMKKVQDKWNHKTVREWPEVLASLKILFGERMEI